DNFGGNGRRNPRQVPAASEGAECLDERMGMGLQFPCSQEGEAGRMVPFRIHQRGDQNRRVNVIFHRPRTRRLSCSSRPSLAALTAFTASKSSPSPLTTRRPPFFTTRTFSFGSGVSSILSAMSS